MIEAESEISKLTEYAIMANYSPAAVGIERTGKILENWKKLRGRLRYAVWLSTWKRISDQVFRRGAVTENNEDLSNGA